MTGDLTGAPVVARNVSKWFGQKVAVSEVDLEIQPGVTGLLGPNGAGKTTLLRVLTGLQRPSQGEVQLLGRDPRSDPGVYADVALVQEDEAVYPSLSARRFVALNATLAGVRDVDDATERAIATVELEEAADRKLAGFSKGMRQRAKVAAALVTEPRVLFLDEPLNGADPIQRAHLIATFQRLGDQGVTVVVSSHVLTEVERMARRVVAMVDGRLAAIGTTSDLRAAMSDKPRRVRIDTDRPRKLAAALIDAAPVVAVTIDESGLDVDTTDAPALARAVPSVALASSTRVTRIAPEDESLESVFRYLMAGRSR